MAEADVAPALTAAVRQTQMGRLNLEVRGVPHSTVVVESSVAVTGPWSEIARAPLNAAGVATTALAASSAESVRFYRVFAE